MMEAVRAWLTSVVLVSVLLSAAQSLIPPGTVRKAAGFTGGLILLLVLLNLAGMGMLRGIRLDVEAAARDIAAILSQRPEPK